MLGLAPEIFFHHSRYGVNIVDVTKNLTKQQMECVGKTQQGNGKFQHY
jgi:hypothetical protein